jgi:hypothetical protein
MKNILLSCALLFLFKTLKLFCCYNLRAFATAPGYSRAECRARCIPSQELCLRSPGSWNAARLLARRKVTHSNLKAKSREERARARKIDRRWHGSGRVSIRECDSSCGFGPSGPSRALIRRKMRVPRVVASMQCPGAALQWGGRRPWPPPTTCGWAVPTTAPSRRRRRRRWTGKCRGRPPPPCPLPTTPAVPRQPPDGCDQQVERGVAASTSDPLVAPTVGAAPLRGWRRRLRPPPRPPLPRRPLLGCWQPGGGAWRTGVGCGRGGVVILLWGWWFLQQFVVLIPV